MHLTVFSSILDGSKKLCKNFAKFLQSFFEVFKNFANYHKPPIAVPDTCLYMTLSKRKLLFSSMNLTDSKMKFLVNRAGIKWFFFWQSNNQ